MPTPSNFNAEVYQEDEWKFASRPESNHYLRLGLEFAKPYSRQEIDEAYQARFNWWRERQKQRAKGQENNPLIKKVGPYIDDSLKYIGQAAACLLDEEKRRAYDRTLERDVSAEREAKLLDFIGFTLLDRLLTTAEKRDLLEQARTLGITSRRAKQMIWEEMNKCGAREVSDEELSAEPPVQGGTRPKPTVDPPRLIVSKTHFSLGTLRKGERRACEFSTDNRGGGKLEGNIEVSDPEWLRMSSTQITGQSNHQDVTIIVDTSDLSLGSSYAGIVDVFSNGGKASIRVDFTVEIEKAAVTRLSQMLLWIGFLIGGLVGYAMYALIPNAGTNLYVALIAGVFATISAVAIGAKLGSWGGGIGAFFLAAIAGPVMKGISMPTYSTGAWATIYAGILCFSARPFLIGAYAKKSGAIFGVALGTVGLTVAIVMGGQMAAYSTAASLQAGTITTCANARGWKTFTAKTEFSVNDPICVYAEALKINRLNQIDVNYTFSLLGPNQASYLTHTDRCLNQNTSADACEAHVAGLRLPTDAPAGTYTLQVSMRNNLTGQTVQASSTFVVTSTSKGSAQGNSSTLLDAVASQKPFIGEASDTSQRWPARLTFVNVDASSGKFTGQLEWMSLNAITKIEGIVSGSTLNFTETGYIRQGPVLLDVKYNLELVDANKLEGHWTSQNGSRIGTTWFSVPVSVVVAGQGTGALSVQALPSAEIVIDGVSKGAADVQGNLVVPDLSAGSHRLAVRKSGYRDAESVVEISAGQTQTATTQLELVVGKFSVQALPGAAVFLDGSERGSTDAQGYLAVYDVPAGAHKLLVKKASLPDFNSDVTVTPGENETFFARLQGDLGRLSIQTMPSAEVYVDGYSRGVADEQGKLIVSDLKTGSHAVSARRSGSELGQVTVSVSAGESKDVRVMPGVSVGFLTVRSNRPDTAFQILDQAANNSIMKFNNSIVDNPFPLGTYVISASAAGMKSETRTVAIEIGKHVVVEFTLGSDH